MMGDKDMTCVTVEQMTRWREAAIELEKRLAEANAKVAELGLANDRLVESLDQNWVTHQTVIDARKQISELTAQLEAANGQGEPVAWVAESIGNPDTFFGRRKPFETEREAKQRAKELEDCGFTDVRVYPAFATPQSAQTTQAAVTAALRKAAEIAEDCYITDASYNAKEDILALPHDDSALREICSAIIEETLDVTGWAVQVKHEVITARVLGELK